MTSPQSMDNLSAGKQYISDISGAVFRAARADNPAQFTHALNSVRYFVDLASLDAETGLGTVQRASFVNTKWRHHSGATYTLLLVSNSGADKTDALDDFPLTAVYCGEDGRVWSRPWSVFVQKFIPIP